MSDGIGGPARRRSLFALIGSLPGLVAELIRSELEQLKNELIRKLKHAGIGVGFLVVASVFAFFATGVLVAAAILGIAVALPPWLAALIVGVGLLLLAALVGFLGIRQLQRGTPPVPTETMRSIQRDVNVIKGTVKRGEP